jgi:hypothetical protein
MYACMYHSKHALGNEILLGRTSAVLWGQQPRHPMYRLDLRWRTSLRQWFASYNVFHAHTRTSAHTNPHPPTQTHTHIQTRLSLSHSLTLPRPKHALSPSVCPAHQQLNHGSLTGTRTCKGGRLDTNPCAVSSTHCAGLCIGGDNNTECHSDAGCAGGGSCMGVGVCNSSTDGSSCTSAATCSTGVCNGMATCRPPNTYASCSDDAECWGNGSCTNSNNGASCSPGAAVTTCTGQGQCIRDNIAWVTLAGNNKENAATWLDLYKVKTGAKPFVTQSMLIKWELAASSPVPGAYSQYLVIFRLEKVTEKMYEFPPGSKLIVTGLTAASASSTIALYTPRDNCDEKKDISSFFAHEQQVGYAEWSSVNKSVTLTLREGYNAGLVHAPSKHAFRFTARSQDPEHLCACTCI